MLAGELCHPHPTLCLIWWLLRFSEGLSLSPSTVHTSPARAPCCLPEPPSSRAPGAHSGGQLTVLAASTAPCWFPAPTSGSASGRPNHHGKRGGTALRLPAGPTRPRACTPVPPPPASLRTHISLVWVTLWVRLVVAVEHLRLFCVLPCIRKGGAPHLPECTSSFHSGGPLAHEPRGLQLALACLLQLSGVHWTGRGDGQQAATTPPASVTILPTAASPRGVRPAVAVEMPSSLSKGCASPSCVCPVTHRRQARA